MDADLNEPYEVYAGLSGMVMTLTPEQREALQAVLNECADQDGLTRRDAIFAAGLRYAYEDAAKICKLAVDEIEAQLARGKGTWPQADYVTDDRWAHLHGSRSASADLERRIRYCIPKDSA